MEFLPVLPAELLSLRATDSALALTPSRLGAAGLFPRGSPRSGEPEAEREPHPFPGLLLGLESLRADGTGLPTGGKHWPSPQAFTLPPPFVPVGETRAEHAMAREFAATVSIATVPGRVTELPPAVQPGPLAERALLLPESTPVRSEGLGHSPAAHDPLPSGPRIESVPEATPLRAWSPTSKSPDAESVRPDAEYVRPDVKSVGADAESARRDARSRGRTFNLEQPLKLEGGRAETPALTDSRGMSRSVFGIVELAPDGRLPAAASATTSPFATAPLASPRGGEIPAAIHMAGPRWSEALAGRVHWMIDQRLGEARIRLNPPELGALDIKISMVDDKAHVLLVASESGARELLETALPRLRELLLAGGLELANASVSDGGRDSRAAHPDPASVAEGQQRELPAPPNAAPTHRPAGQIDLYA